MFPLHIYSGAGKKHWCDIESSPIKHAAIVQAGSGRLSLALSVSLSLYFEIDFCLFLVQEGGQGVGLDGGGGTATSTMVAERGGGD